MNPDKEHNALIRKKIKHQRSALSKQQLAIAHKQLGLQLRQHLAFFKAKKIASYIPCNGEISPIDIHKHINQATYFLPRISHLHSAKMAFYPLTNPRIKNHYGITEPLASGTPIPLNTCDIILVPLVAFDRQGNRIGMGAGFYDRALSFKQTTQNIKRPILLGLAHDFQEVNKISAQSWDIPLDAILTNRELIKINL